MTQKERCLIVISKKNYEELRKRGILTASFDSVITNLLEQTRSQSESQQSKQSEVIKKP